MSNLRLTREMKDSMLGLIKAFAGNNPVVKVDEQYYLRFDAINMTTKGVVFFYKGTALMEYPANIGKGESVSFTGMDGLNAFGLD